MDSTSSTNVQLRVFGVAKSALWKQAVNSLKGWVMNVLNFLDSDVFFLISKPRKRLIAPVNRTKVMIKMVVNSPALSLPSPPPPMNWHNRTERWQNVLYCNSDYVEIHVTDTPLNLNVTLLTSMYFWQTTVCTVSVHRLPSVRGLMQVTVVLVVLSGHKPQLDERIL